MHDTFEDEIRDLLASGNKIAAIKRYREETRAGLVEAKLAVESLEAGRSFTKQIAQEDSEFNQQIVALLGRGEKIEAVKLYRDRFRVDLKGAKEAVERIGEQNGIPASSGSGGLGIVLLGMALVVGLLN